MKMRGGYDEAEVVVVSSDSEDDGIAVGQICSSSTITAMTNNIRSSGYSVEGDRISEGA